MAASKFSAVLSMALILLAGCGGNKRPLRSHVPPPPEIQVAASHRARTRTHHPSHPLAPTPEGHSRGGKPSYVETGLASWYGEPYHHQRGSNGEVFNMHLNTAAHRTLPLNSVARVTNIRTGQSVIVRITDRGPFVPGRILDLSKAAALAIDVWRPGTALVRLELLESPAPVDQGGRWAVQIGAFDDPDNAAQLKAEIAEKYPKARVLQFSGPTGEWVRVRVPADDRSRAEQIARSTSVEEAKIFLVRLD